MPILLEQQTLPHNWVNAPKTQGAVGKSYNHLSNTLHLPPLWCDGLAKCDNGGGKNPDNSLKI